MPDATTSTRERDGPPTPTLQPNAHTVKPTTDLGMGGGGVIESRNPGPPREGGGCANKAPGYKDSGVTVPGLFFTVPACFLGFRACFLRFRVFFLRFRCRWFRQDFAYTCHKLGWGVPYLLVTTIKTNACVGISARHDISNPSLSAHDPQRVRNVDMQPCSHISRTYQRIYILTTNMDGPPHPTPLPRTKVIV